MDTDSIYHTKSAGETEKLGQKIGHSIRKTPDKKYRFLLRGELGSGKTTFVRGLLSGLGYSGRVLSPTFTFIRAYYLDSCMMYHLDLYRGADDAIRETVSEILSGTGVLAIEWPEKLDIEWPRPYTEISFESLESEHVITISTYADSCHPEAESRRI